MKNQEKTIFKLAQKYNTPLKVQKYLRSLNYNKEEKKESLRSALTSIQLKKSHCLEACFIAALLLEKNGYPPLVLSFESKDNLDHVIYIYQKNKKWGSIARSRDEGLHGRKAIFSTIEELVDSYYDPYVDATGCITGFQIANLNDIKSDWRYSKKNVWSVERYLIQLKHQKIKKNAPRYKKLFKNYKLKISLKSESYWL